MAAGPHLSSDFFSYNAKWPIAKRIGHFYQDLTTRFTGRRASGT
jgi:hypothetical protein